MSDTYNAIFEKNRKWASIKKIEEPDFFINLSKQQNPEFLFIGCSDSRVPANTLTSTNPGEMFVHRNIANVVANTDMNVMTVIQYAVQELKVKHIVVCGHYGCGGVQAAMKKQSLGLLDKWLKNIRDVYRIHRDELTKIKNFKNKFDRLVELNVEEQCINVIKTNFVLNSYSEKGYPQVHGWVYDISQGLLKDLNLDFPKILENLKEIYHLSDDIPAKK
ncbi:MAG: carbonic anhydrase [Cyclobacteriaceae bacterium]|nr:carbonic anhydrase [Cyclobacteriaceae bacterium]